MILKTFGIAIIPGFMGVTLAAGLYVRRRCWKDYLDYRVVAWRRCRVSAPVIRHLEEQLVTCL